MHCTVFFRGSLKINSSLLVGAYRRPHNKFKVNGICRNDLSQTEWGEANHKYIKHKNMTLTQKTCTFKLKQAFILCYAILCLGMLWYVIYI